MHVGVLGVYRPQFDAESAESAVKAVARALAGVNELAVTELPMLEEWQVARDLADIREAAMDLDALVVVMGTFVGADVVLKVTQGLPFPTFLWTVPEPLVEGGGRLKLNSLCGGLMTNHAFKQMGISAPLIYGDPEDGASVAEFLSTYRAQQAVKRLAATVIGVVGEHPPGYYPCDYDELELYAKFGVRVVTVPLAEAFSAAEAVGEADVQESRQAAAGLAQLDQINPAAVTKSLQAEVGLRRLISERSLSAVTVECWPAYMTEFGGAVCWAMSRLIDDGIMAGCEADVHGTLTMLMCRELGLKSPFFGDLVHVQADDRLVFWHCGAAPLSLAGEAPRASQHPNRKVGLTLDFALDGGSATVVRLHHGADGYALMAIEGEAVAEPLYFSGNTGVFRPRRSAKAVLQDLTRGGAEHHFAMGYGVSVADVSRLGDLLDLPVHVY